MTSAEVEKEETPVHINLHSIYMYDIDIITGHSKIELYCTVIMLRCSNTSKHALSARFITSFILQGLLPVPCHGK